MRKRLMGLAVVVVVLLVGAGVATGASRYLLTSTHQIKPSVLQALRSNDRGKTGARGNAGPTGTRGTTGQTGQAGLAGPAGAFSTTNVTQAGGASSFMCASGSGNCDVGSSVATCPTGSVALGGGWDGESNPPVVATVAYNEPLGTDSWEVIMANNGSISANFHAVATCGAPTGTGQTPSAAPGLTASQQHQLADDLAAARRSR
jgi:hypothetical protein